MTAIKKPLTLLLISLAILGAAGIWLAQNNSSDQGANSLAKPANVIPDSAHPSTPLNASGLPLPAKVQQKINDKNASEKPFLFNIEYIFNALSEVRVDRDGALVLDGHTLDILEAALSKITVELSEDELAELQEMITLGLPGDAGLEAAKIFKDYYHYRSAEKDFLQSNASSDIDDINTNFEQMVALRQAHLGFDVAEKLYGDEQRASLFMIKAMKIQDDPGLSNEEKEKLQLELSEALETQLGAKEEVQEDTETVQWLMRFENFDQQRQYILDAGLSKSEQEQQVEALLKQHFAADEIDKARSFIMP